MSVCPRPSRKYSVFGPRRWPGDCTGWGDEEAILILISLRIAELCTTSLRLRSPRPPTSSPRSTTRRLRERRAGADLQPLGLRFRRRRHWRRRWRWRCGRRRRRGRRGRRGRRRRRGRGRWRGRRRLDDRARAKERAVGSTFEVRLDQSSAVTDVWLWVGTAGAQCEALDRAQRDDRQLRGGRQQPATSWDQLHPDRPRPAGSARRVVRHHPHRDCESSGLAGTEYQLFVFREAPSGDVSPESYGIAPFFIDVENPAAPLVNTSEQRQSTFNIGWSTPNPPDDIQSWELWYSTPGNPTPVKSGRSSTLPDDRNLTIFPADMGLSVGDSATSTREPTIRPSSRDPFGGNLSELSDGVPVTYLEVAGYCDASGNCGGCSVSPMALAGGLPGAFAWISGWCLRAIFAWRLRR